MLFTYLLDLENERKQFDNKTAFLFFAAQQLYELKWMKN